MQYYALFLDTNGFIEKSLALIKYICNPRTKTYPHITMRVFKEKGLGTDQIEKVKISYLNLFDIGNFNISQEQPPYVVYVRCESEQLEALEYKPDYPFSQLHITFYEGNDIVFAKQLFNILSSIEWNIKLSFKNNKTLVERTIGEKSLDETFFQYIQNATKEIFNDNISLIELSNDKKLEYIQIIVKRIERYKSNTKISIPNSYYESTPNYDWDNSIKSNAIYITPPEYAREMVETAMPFLDSSCINFGDSSIGTGSLYLALLNVVSIDRINSAIGIDVDENMVREAKRKFTSRKLEVYHKDALFIDDTIINRKRNLMLVNPPYNRSHEISPEYRNQIEKLAYEDTGITVPKNAGLYVYHLLILDKWLDQDGIAVWLLPSSFLQTQYGSSIRDYLTNKVTLLKLHSYDDEKEQFSNASISTTIVVFKKKKPLKTDDNVVEVSHGFSATQAKVLRIPLSSFYEEKDNWRKIILGSLNNNQKCEYRISDLFEIKRGLATGANSFFVLEREKARELNIPSFALKPILPKSRLINGRVINSEVDGYPRLDKQLVLIDCDLPESIIQKDYPDFFKYLNKAKEPDKNGKKIIERTLVRSRKPWYKQEKRTPSKYLLTYMGRQKADSPSLYFLLNKSRALALNTYMLLYPKPWLMDLLEKNERLDEELLSCLNDSAYLNIEEGVRIYAGALQKIEPSELRKWNLYNLPKIIRDFLID